MGKRTIISAEMRLLNRIKKKKIHTIAAMLFIFAVFSTAAITFSMLEAGAGWKNTEAAPYATDTDADTEDAADNDKDNEPDDVPPATQQDASEATSQDAENPDTDTEAGEAVPGNEDIPDDSQASVMEGNTDFRVPPTSLPDVEDIQGSDWYSSDMYAPRNVTEVGDSYFDSSIFIGDSRTEGLALYGGQSNMNAFSYKGLSVDKISTEKCIPINGVNYTVEEAIAMTEYDNYYIQFGINELGWIYTDRFAENVSTLVDIIYEHNPDANVYVSNIVPVSRSVSDTDDVFNINNVRKFNEVLYDMCVERGDVVYLDVASSVSDADGYLPEEASTDGKHCNADYCKRIIKYIRLHTYERVEG